MSDILVPGKSIAFFLLLLVILVAGSGCFNSLNAPVGATVGSAQDIGYARQIINDGGIPSPDMIVAEGLYSEHDIATLSGFCDNRLCLSLGYGYGAAADDGRSALFVQLGMTSTITSGQFKRPHLQLALVIDKSGSMEGNSMISVKSALRSLVEKLTPDDEIALVSFNTGTDLLLPMTQARSRSAILKAIDKLEAGGGTNIEAGLTLGFDLADNAPARDGSMKRVMLFTDAMPNQGRTDNGSFKEIVSRYANKDIGLTAFGVGVDFGQQLAYYITGLRGGNFVFLETPEKIRKVFDTEFDYLVTPIVYDLNITLPTPPGMRLRNVYGLPSWKPGDRDAKLNIPTVFLSSNRGAIILRYERDDTAELAVERGDLLAGGTIEYAGPASGAHSQAAEVRHTGDRLVPGSRYYSHDGARMAVALTNIYLGLREGCQLAAEGEREKAIAIVEAAAASAEADNAVLRDAALADDIRLLRTLAVNMAKR